MLPPICLSSFNNISMCPSKDLTIIRSRLYHWSLQRSNQSRLSSQTSLIGRSDTSFFPFRTMCFQTFLSTNQFQNLFVPFVKYSPYVTEIEKGGGGQCDQIGRFLQVLGEKFSHKSSPNVQKLFGRIWKHQFLSKNCRGHFLGHFWNFCLLFISASGHTGGGGCLSLTQMFVNPL